MRMCTKYQLITIPLPVWLQQPRVSLITQRKHTESANPLEKRSCDIYESDQRELSDQYSVHCYHIIMLSTNFLEFKMIIDILLSPH